MLLSLFFRNFISNSECLFADVSARSLRSLILDTVSLHFSRPLLPYLSAMCLLHFYVRLGLDRGNMLFNHMDRAARIVGVYTHFGSLHTLPTCDLVLKPHSF